jgi:hypothetical protein
VRPEGLGKLKNFNDVIGSRTSDVAVRSKHIALTTTLSRALMVCVYWSCILLIVATCSYLVLELIYRVVSRILIWPSPVNIRQFNIYY